MSSLCSGHKKIMHLHINPFSGSSGREHKHGNNCYSGFFFISLKSLETAGILTRKFNMLLKKITKKHTPQD